MQFPSVLCIFIKLMHFKLNCCILTTMAVGTYSKVIYVLLKSIHIPKLGISS